MQYAISNVNEISTPKHISKLIVFWLKNLSLTNNCSINNVEMLPLLSIIVFKMQTRAFLSKKGCRTPWFYNMVTKRHFGARFG